MKKVKSKSSILEIENEKQNDPYEIIYADPRDEEIHLKFLKQTQINAHMARWFLDHEYNQLIWSDGIFETLEIDPRKYGASFSNYLEVVHPEDRKIKIQAQEDLKTNRKPLEINYRLLFNNGRTKWINEICNTDFDNDGNPIRSYGTIQDITKYKLSEKTFRQKEEQFKSLIDSVPSLIGIIDDGKLEFINPAGSQLLGGILPQQLKGIKISKIIPFNSRRNFTKRLKSVSLGQTGTMFEEKMMKLDGSVFDAEIKFVGTTFKGNPAIQMIANDITSRKKNNENLLNSEKRFQELKNTLLENEIRLKELIGTKDKFFSIIAHDLRIPFNSIIGFLDLLLNQYDKFSDSERKNYLTLIDADANRTLKLLDDLLEWAKLQTGKISFQQKKQKLLPIIESVLSTLGSAINFKQLQISHSVSNDFEIIADHNMLTTIFQNLIGNAIKYSYPHGIITINAYFINNQLECSVSDNGIGMSEEIKNKLFRIDQQASVSGTANERGGGLGLFLCKDFVEKHDGKIWVESELGKGSKFFLRIPQNLH